MSDNPTKTDGLYALTEPTVMTFNSLFEPRQFGKKGKQSGVPKYNANFLLKPDSSDLAGMKAKAAEVARAKWPGRALKELKFPFSNGDTLAETAIKNGKKAEFNRGHIVIAARSQYEPRLSGVENGKIVDYDGDARLKAKAKFYPGVLVFAQVNFVPYDGVGANPDGVTAYLNMVFSTNKGDKLPIGGASAAETFKGYVGHATAEDPTAGAGLDDEIPF